MKDDQKNLLISGGVLAIISAIYIMTVGIPNTPTSALLFPLSILGLMFGIGFIAWSLAWIGLEKTRILK